MQQRVGLNAVALRPGGAGVSTYIRELLGAFARTVDVRLVARIQRDAMTEVPSSIAMAQFPPTNGARRVLTAHVPFARVDLVHGLDVDLPLYSGVPLVTTIHDLAAFDAPWCMSHYRAYGERLITRSAVRRADVVIAVSDFTARRIRDLFSRDAVTIPLAASPAFRPADADAVADVVRRYALPSRFVLQVGTIEPRKDTHMLSAACRELGVPLVLAGTAPRNHASLPGSLQLGYVPSHDLPPLYGAATVVAYISRYEGFGLPPLEAMACGAPVVCTDVASLRDTVGDAALVVPPGDLPATVDALRRLLGDDTERTTLAVAGHRRALQRSWDNVAHETGLVYESLGIRVTSGPTH
jgi:glycosyltransferase involved in cell wall biosynthesis